MYVFKSNNFVDMQVPGQAAGTLIMLKGRDLDKALKKLFDPLTKKLTSEALEAC